MKRSFLTLMIIMALLVMIPAVSIASSVLIGDSSGNIGMVDTTTGVSSGLFNPSGVDALTDIAYDPFGNLWGITFDDLYRIDVASGSATPIGPLGSGIDFNALTFGADGTAYAMGNISASLFTLDLNTGAATGKDVGFESHGDLAFDNNGNLFLSATPGAGGTNSRLVQIFGFDTMAPSGSLVGPNNGDLGMAEVFGLAFTDGIMFGAAGNKVFEIDLNNASTRNERIFDGGLSLAYGASGPNPVPVPATMLLLGTGLAALAGFRHKFRLSS